MKEAFQALLIVTAALSLNSSEIQGIPSDWIDLDGECLEHMRAQIQKEIDASYVYMAMGAHFMRDVINRPGFGEMLFRASREEREHARRLIDYISMRGKLTNNVTGLIKTPKIRSHSWADGVAALTDALILETNVTRSIRAMIKICEHERQLHLVDYLTGVFLEEQLHGQRELAGMISTLQKLRNKHGDLGEFLFDLDLLAADPKRSDHF